MSEWYDNLSAEVVLRQPRSWSNERKCLDRCLKLRNPAERELITQVFGDQKGRNELALQLGVSVGQLKQIRSRLVKCMNQCLEEAEDKVFPGF